MLSPEDEGDVIFRIVGSHSPKESASAHRKPACILNSTADVVSNFANRSSYFGVLSKCRSGAPGGAAGCDTALQAGRSPVQLPKRFLRIFIDLFLPLHFRNLGKSPVENVTDNYGRTAVCAKCGDKTGLTGVIGSARSAKLQCHLSTKARRSPQQPGKNLYFKEEITIVGLSGIIPQI